ncbi:hypothetical protein E3983_06595 [Legionella israelensis]|uniref:Fe-S protein n=1 Tax=Legionella israelensis TaxID=454 RepID=A0A0W0VUK4_9GAMM|nr:hypothetical protein [Legionella israelensis]KTD23681.1 Fe-S protein [Legionella israelensis]QBR84050.1 hypothetical protein E3983_06595 [Legionella israelensis]QBS10936.1 hypothetical protein E4T55_14455 [Legionella israelensis]SCX79630.1 hypothetical protein SAMN02746069_00224 [Legionella israelensis DSM 19235]STX57927.1 Fe-S protein [Legionella israelensis]
MRQIKKICSVVLLSSCFSQASLSQNGPWFTGPLLAPAGHIIPTGHTNVEIYGIHTENDGIFNRHGKLIHTPTNSSTILNPLLSHGLSDYVDIQISVPYTYNSNLGEHSNGFTDNSVILGFQLLEQKNSRWRPDLRVSLNEILPAGKYDQLNPGRNGTDAKGLGSYQTSIGFHFQHLLPVFKTHYLRTRLSLNHIYASKVKIHGLSTYGGAVNTNGRIRPGNFSSIDLAGEFTLTQHWVAVMEGFAAYRQGTQFKGFRGTTATGMPASIGHGTVQFISLAPAIEYNFNANYGIIAGVWFDLKGKETVKFVSPMVAFNAFW